jgi:hypothetical protein
MRHTIDACGVTIQFDDKPSDTIRSILKAHGFRWSPQSRLWWRRRVTGAADAIDAIRRELHKGEPDGACWKCGKPGRFRNRGAATPVLCDEHATREE